MRSAGACAWRRGQASGASGSVLASCCGVLAAHMVAWSFLRGCVGREVVAGDVLAYEVVLYEVVAYEVVVW